MNITPVDSRVVQNPGPKPITIMYNNANCIGCGICFQKKSGNHARCKQCSIEHTKQYARINAHRYYHSKGKRIIKKCLECEIEFSSLRSYNRKFCSRRCFEKDQAKKRLGKGNPAYRNGTRVGGKTHFKKIGDRIYAKTLGEIREWMLETKGYLWCENCGTTNTMKWEGHHICYRSETPHHPNLHNRKNIIHCCILCHNWFHKSRKNRAKLIHDRKLYELFPDKHYLKKEAEQIIPIRAPLVVFKGSGWTRRKFNA